MARLKEFDEDSALDAAVDCFWSRGYEATSVRDLAREMGIGGASLYNTFGGKRALFERVLERYANRSTRERIARLEAEPSAPRGDPRLPRRGDRAFVEGLRLQGLPAGELRARRGAPRSPNSAARSRATSKRFALLPARVEAANKAGETPPGTDAKALSIHLLGVLMGMRVLARTGARRQTLEAVVRPALDLLGRPH